MIWMEAKKSARENAGNALTMTATAI